MREDEGEAERCLPPALPVEQGGKRGEGEMRQAQMRLQAAGGGKERAHAAVVEAVGGLQAGELDVDEAVVVKHEVVAQAVTALPPAGERQPGAEFRGAAGKDAQHFVARAGVDEGAQVVVVKRVVVRQAAQQAVFFDNPNEALRVALRAVARFYPAGDEVAVVELLVDGRQRRALALQQRQQGVVVLRLPPAAADSARVQERRGFVVVGERVVLLAAGERRFIGLAQTDEAVRVAVGAVFFQELRVGALDRGFVAGRRDAEDVPAVHVRSRIKGGILYNVADFSLPEFAMNLTVIDHPLVAHKLSLMREADCSTYRFRTLTRELARLMAYEASRELPSEPYTLQCWSGEITGRRIAGKTLTVVPILRAGLGMLDGVLDLIPTAKISVVGLQRDEETLQPVSYFEKFTSKMDERPAWIIDPMLATGGSLAATISLLKSKGCKDIKALVLVAAPEGVKLVNDAHPDVRIYAAALDSHLNENGYIIPGLGDAGDKIFGTVIA